MQKAKDSPKQHIEGKQFSLKCQCSLQKNNIPFKLNSKSKFCSLVLRPPRKLTIHPFSKVDVLAEFDVSRIRSIQRRFIDQGKITLEIYDGTEAVNILGTDISLDKPSRRELLTHIFINNSIKQSLEIFIDKIGSMQKELKKTTEKIFVEAPKKMNERVSKEQEEKPAKRALSRRDLIKDAHDEEQKLAYQEMRKSKQANRDKKLIIANESAKLKPINRLDNLPMEVFKMIMGFVGECPLSLRVLSRKISDFVLSGIKRMRLNDEIDEECFKKLTKNALYVECRMKNIKDIGHFTNLSEEGPIDRLNSRWLNFSKWKEMTMRHIDQLKGLRFYCLEIPYGVKFESQCLIALKLVCLKLKGSKTVQLRNPNIQDAHIALLVNTCQYLTMLQIGCVGDEFLDSIKNPQKMLMLKIGTLQIGRDRTVAWNDFRKFTNLKTLSVRHTIDLNQRTLELSQDILMKFPVGLTKLKLGTFVNIETIMKQLPPNLECLSLAGEHIQNQHIREIHLPNIKVLDIRECPGISLGGLTNCLGIRLKTKWENYMVDASLPFLFERGITITNEKVSRY